ncbi:DsbA family protein [Nonomuraea sp. SBT364]|uniref:DsbA family protein n=1 Tax=Nonomuraea sp. SBT364 TaxID=1580530 RepID=UPI001E64A315|nr:thioredoxin domain-containing protein [Nonomuraea sp. SBT364]
MDAGSRRRAVLGAVVGAAVLAVLGVAALDVGGEGGKGGESATTTGTTVTSPATSPAISPAPSGASPADAGATARESPGGTVWEGPTPPPVDMKLAKGSAGAPVTIVEFGDFQCPNCRRYAREIEPVLKRDYIDTGVVRVFWRDYPIRGEASVEAAYAARAASLQGRFWEFRGALFAGGTRVTAGRLRAAAVTAGLDMARFDRDRRGEAVRRAVDHDTAFAYQLGLPGTPAFLVNGELLFGAQPVSAFREAIEKARRGG